MRNKNSIQKNKVSKRVDYELQKWDAVLKHISETITFEPVKPKEEVKNGE
jgi:hypothetical protein